MPHRSPLFLRGAVAVTIAATALGGLAAAPAMAATTKPSASPSASAPLRILLTNDDGWNAPGITAVYNALVAAGHDVTMFAPSTNQSGVGARATFGGSLEVTHPEEGKYAISGSPADSVEAALSTVYAAGAPDLVISGTNTGQNIAAATVHSGTIGAAVTALNDGIPAIAVSTETSFTSAAQPPFDATAAFVVKLVTQLQKQAGHGKRLLPGGLGLNVNFPIVENGGPTKGVALTNTGMGFLDVVDSGVLPAVGGTSSLSVSVNPTVPETVKNADSTALAADKIAITPITGNYDTVPSVTQLSKLVAGLR